MLNEYTKVDEGEIYIIVIDPMHYISYYYSLEEYMGYAQYYDVVYIKTISGELVEEISLGNVYVVELQEKNIETENY